MALPKALIEPKLIYLEPIVREYPRGREVLSRFPHAELVEVASHWNIPQLADPALAGDWLRVKRDTLVLGVKKSLAIRPNGRSGLLARSFYSAWRSQHCQPGSLSFQASKRP